MAEVDAQLAMPRPVRAIGILAAVTASLLLGACAQIGGDESSGLLAALTPGAEETRETAQAAAPSDPQAAVDYWGKQYSKNPRDLEAALSYSQNLKVIGQKREALTVLQQASLIHGSDRKLLADYGRLALDLDQVSLAKKLLEAADDPVNPNWRVILARGTALAKEGSYREAISFYERAQVLNPGHPSILNNLALAHTMSGDPARGEQLLRQASGSGSENAKVRQNLALVLGLQGKYEEATKVGSVDLAPTEAQANTALLQKMVKVAAKPMTPAMPSQDSWTPAVATAPTPVAQKPATQARAQAAAPMPVLRSSTMETGFGASASRDRAAMFSAE